MDRRERNPLDGINPQLVKEHGAHSEFGRLLRIAESNTRLSEMAEQEYRVADQERQAAQITDRIQRGRVLHTVNMRYLIEFGVCADERQHFREILEENANHGGLTLREAANLAQARAQHQNGTGADEIAADES